MSCSSKRREALQIVISLWDLIALPSADPLWVAATAAGRWTIDVLWWSNCVWPERCYWSHCPLCAVWDRHSPCLQRAPCFDADWWMLQAGSEAFVPRYVCYKKYKSRCMCECSCQSMFVCLYLCVCECAAAVLCKQIAGCLITLCQQVTAA